MNRLSISFPILATFALVFMLSVSSWVSPGTIVPLQQPTPTLALPTMPAEDSWIIIDLPADATQLEYGAEVYRLVCKACHGDKGQGLTDDWRAQWAPEDQNCWQSKCHALNHPPDGFYMPPVPAVIGQPVMAFGNALNLYTYTHKYMPWHDRGSMTEKESWSVTAYLLKINGIDPGPELNAETAAKISLREITTIPSVAPPQVTTSAPASHEDLSPTMTVFEPVKSTPLWLWLLGLAVIVLVLFFLQWLRKTSS